MLQETPAGFALFKVDDAKVKSAETEVCSGSYWCFHIHVNTIKYYRCYDWCLEML